MGYGGALIRRLVALKGLQAEAKAQRGEVLHGEAVNVSTPRKTLYLVSDYSSCFFMAAIKMGLILQIQ